MTYETSAAAGQMLDRERVVREILQEHLNIGPKKPVSYLPIKTIEKVLKLSVDAYVGMTTTRGHSSVAFGPDQCCIDSGAVYLYSQAALQQILDQSAGTLMRENYPLDSRGFIAALARDWLPGDHPVMPVIRQAFGDDQQKD